MALELKAKVSLDGSGFQSGLDKMSHGAEKFTDRLKDMAVEAFGIIAITEAVKRTVEYASKLVDTANRLGVSIEKMQEFGFAAKMTGAHMEDLVGFMEHLNQSRVDPHKFAAFSALGVSAADLKSAPVEELMMKISGNARGRSPQELDGPLREIGGRGAGALIGMLRENLEELFKKAHDFKQVMDDRTTLELKYLGDQMAVLSQAITVGLAPAIIKLLEWLLSSASVAKAAAVRAGVMNAGSGYTGPVFLGSSILDAVKDATRIIWDPNFQMKDARSPLFGSLRSMGTGNFQYPWETDAGKAKMDVVKAADAAAAASRAEDKKTISDLEKALADAQKNKLFVPNFSSLPEAPMHHLSGSIPTDSLLRVGNLLGDNGSTFSNVAKQQLDYLKMIEANTRPSPGGRDDVNFGNP